MGGWIGPQGNAENWIGALAPWSIRSTWIALRPPVTWRRRRACTLRPDMAWHAELWLCWVYPQLDYDYTYMMYTYAVWRWWGGNCICDCILEFTMVCYHIYIYIYMCIYDYIIYIIICTYIASPIAHFIALGILVPRRSPLLQRGGWPWGCQLSSPVEGGHVPHLGGATKGAVHCCSWAAQDSALGRWRGWCVYTYIIIIIVVVVVVVVVVIMCIYICVCVFVRVCICICTDNFLWVCIFMHLCAMKNHGRLQNLALSRGQSH